VWPLRGVGHPAVRGEALLRREGAHAAAPVGAVEQVAAEAVPGLPEVPLHHRHGAVGLRAARVHTVPPGVHPVRGQQERGPLLDGGLGPDDALPDGVEVAHTRVHRVGRPMRLVLLQLLAKFLQELLDARYLGFQIRDGQRAGVAASDGGQQRGAGEQQPGMLEESHVVHTQRGRLPPPRPAA